MHLDQNIAIVASNIINLAKKEGITAGKSPTGMVAAAIYLASIHVNKPVTQRIIGEELDVTEATIRNRGKELKKLLKKKNLLFSANSSDIKPELT